MVGVFIHWEAKDNKKIYDFNYRATKEAIGRAMKGQPSVEVITRRTVPSTRSPDRPSCAVEWRRTPGRGPTSRRAARERVCMTKRIDVDVPSM